MQSTTFEHILESHRGAFQSAGAPEPVPKLPHVHDPRYVSVRRGTPTTSVLDVFAFHDVVEELCYRALYDPERESFSLLTGGWFVGPYGNYVEIDGFRDTVSAPDASAYCTQLRRDKKLLFDDDEELVVGCCAVRRGGRGEMQPDDLLMLNTFFNHPYQVYILIDGAADNIAFYARNAAGRFVNVPVTLLALQEDAGLAGAPLDLGAKITDGSRHLGEHSAPDQTDERPALEDDASSSQPDP